VKRVAGQTRAAILAAAAAEFAAHGFAGASVDDIAARAGFNKAMIYYHFRNKQALYVEILRDVFRLMGTRTTDIAASDLQPGAKIEAFIDALDEMAEGRSYMPPIMMREMAEGARRLDAATLRLMAVIFRNLARILDQGARLGVFRPADPTLTYFSLIAPVIFFRGSAPIRAAFGKTRILTIRADSAAFVANLKRTARAALAPGAGAEAGTAGAKAPAHVRTQAAGGEAPAHVRRLPRPTRSGDHA
jgi:TetR/AcrR family transcriptional regulator